MAPTLSADYLLKDQAFIDGQWVKAKSGKTFEVTSESRWISSYDDWPSKGSSLKSEWSADSNKTRPMGM